MSLHRCREHVGRDVSTVKREVVIAGRESPGDSHGSARNLDRYHVPAFEKDRRFAHINADLPDRQDTVPRNVDGFDRRTAVAQVCCCLNNGALGVEQTSGNCRQYAEKIRTGDRLAITPGIYPTRSDTGFLSKLLDCVVERTVGHGIRLERPDTGLLAVGCRLLVVGCHW